MKLIFKKIKSILSDMDKVLLFFTVFLFLYGLLNIVTASSREALSYDYDLYYYFFQQSKMLLIGLLGSIIIINIDTKHYKKFIPILYFIILSILIYLYINGEFNRGSKNWIRIFGFKFQPSEFAKIIIIVTMAQIYELFYKKLKNRKEKHYNLIGFILFMIVSYPIIIYLQKDFGTMFIMLSILALMFLASPILRIEKIKTIFYVLIIGVACGSLALLISGKELLTKEQLSRLNYFNPCSNYEQGGYQVCNAFIAINNGGLTGLGIGKSQQKYSYIPEPHTDSVFAIFIEEWGLIAGAIVFICYIVILKRIFNIASLASTIRGRYIAFGVGVYIFMHIFINLGGLFGVIPLTGVPLPFLSYGGSFTISLMASLAIVQRINIETKNQKIKITGVR